MWVRELRFCIRKSLTDSVGLPVSKTDDPLCKQGQLDKVDYHTRRRMSNTLVAGMNKDEPLADHLSDLFKKATEETLEVDETTLIRGAGKFFKKKADQSMLTSFDKDTNTELEVSTKHTPKKLLSTVISI